MLVFEVCSVFEANFHPFLQPDCLIMENTLHMKCVTFGDILPKGNLSQQFHNLYTSKIFPYRSLFYSLIR